MNQETMNQIVAMSQVVAALQCDLEETQELYESEVEETEILKSNLNVLQGKFDSADKLFSDQLEKDVNQYNRADIAEDKIARLLECLGYNENRHTKSVTRNWRAEKLERKISSLKGVITKLKRAKK